MFGNKMMCGCCGGGGTVDCPAKIRVRSCSGTPVSGATVAGFNPPPASPEEVRYGSTNGAGVWDAGVVTPATGRDWIKVQYNGTGISFPFPGATPLFCDPTYFVNLCYIDITLTVNSTAAADPTLGGVPGEIDDGGTITLPRKLMTNLDCAHAQVTESVHVLSQVDGYLDNCQDVTYSCSESSVSVPLYNYEADYAFGGGQCDQGCEAAGMGPGGRGLFPKRYYMTWSSDYGLFGGYEGVPVAIDWTGDGFNWTSGCIPGNNVPCANPAGYASVEMGIADDIHFTAFQGLGCVDDPTADPHCNPLRVTLGFVGGQTCVLTSPVDFTGTDTATQSGIPVRVHITE